MTIIRKQEALIRPRNLDRRPDHIGLICSAPDTDEK
jgi:hypothetical protein